MAPVRRWNPLEPPGRNGVVFRLALQRPGQFCDVGYCCTSRMKAEPTQNATTEEIRPVGAQPIEGAATSRLRVMGSVVASRASTALPIR